MFVSKISFLFSFKENCTHFGFQSFAFPFISVFIALFALFYFYTFGYVSQIFKPKV